MASDLTGKSRTKLAQARIKRADTHTNIRGTKFKQNLVLKLKIPSIEKSVIQTSNTSVSHFMEIQQKEKESLAAYIHRFKGEANRYNFNNNTATIWIFIKGLRNAHTLGNKSL